jgi:KipI family sensor histidine kinase inhibitor
MPGESMLFPIYQPAGDRAVLVSFEERIAPEINERLRFFSQVLRKQDFPWLEETVFSYRSVLVIYDPLKIRFAQVAEALNQVERSLAPAPPSFPDMYEIPTVYGGAHGPDLQRVAEVSGCTPREAIDLYASTTFTIYFLGFLCAQPYLGGLPEKLRVPRLDNPRLHMPAGSVGIGGIQASLLTIDQPSGHNFIGRTFLSLYDPGKMPPSLLKAGDRVIFRPISEEEIPATQGKDPIKKEK